MKLRRAGGVIVAGLLALGLYPASAQELDGDPALETIATCVRDRGHLLVMLLMDESESLGQTDPDNERVPAAKAALSNLRTLAGIEFEGRSPTVEVAISAFATDYTLVTDFTALDAQTVQQLHASLDTFAQRNVGFDTDYVMAIGGWQETPGARQDLARRSSEVTVQGAEAPCKTLMVFTDGDYDIELRRTADQVNRRGLYRPYEPDLRLDQQENPGRVVEIGKDLICRPGGIRDELVADDIVLATISFSDEVSDDATDWLGAVARGRTEQQTCGLRASPENGTFIHAHDLAELLAAFNRITNEIGGGAREPGAEQLPVCPLASCPEGTREFEIDETLSRFHLLADLGLAGMRIELRSPGARDPWVLPGDGAGAHTLGSAELRYEWLSSRAMTVDALLPRDTRDWVGTWSITFIDPTGENPDAVANSQIYLYGDLSPQLMTLPQLRLGETAELVVEIVDSAGGQLAPETVEGAVVVDATITDPTTEQEESVLLEGPGADGRFSGGYVVSDDLSASYLVLNLRAVVTTAAGVRLAPFTRTYQLPISPPLVFPHTEPAELRLSSITGVGSATGTLHVVGGEGQGCVWIDDVRTLNLPDGAGELSHAWTPTATEDNCLAVGQGERHEIEFEFSNEDLASGRATGLLGVALSVQGEDRIIRQEIPWRFEMSRPVDQARRILLLLVLLVLLLLPLALQYLLNWFSARFEPAHELLASRVPVVVRSNGRIERTDQGSHGRAFTPDLVDFSNVGGPSRPSRELDIGEVHFRGRLSRSPLNPPYGEASVPGAAVTGPYGHRKRDTGLCGKVPLGLTGSWVFVLDEEATFATAPEDEPDQPDDVHGTLLAILSYGAGGAFTQQADRLLTRLDADLPPIGRSLAQAAAHMRPAPHDGDSETGPSSDPGHGPTPPEYATTPAPGSPFPSSNNPFPSTPPAPTWDDKTKPGADEPAPADERSAPAPPPKPPPKPPEY